jgi:hypothetical protein
MDKQTEEITVEVSERTARELEEIAWSFGVARETLLKRVCETIAEESEN